jgi:signal recognition particle subunit SRP72
LIVLACLTVRCTELCHDLDDLTPEEKEAELEPVIVQEIYLLVRTGHLERAKELAGNFDAKK